MLPNRLTRVAPGTPRPDPPPAPILVPEIPKAPPPPPPPEPEPPLIDFITPALEELVLGLSKAVGEIQAIRDKKVAEVREIGVELAFIVARKILGDNVSRFPIEEMVREASVRWSMRGVLKLHLHPEDLNLLRERLQPDSLVPDRSIQWIADPTVTRGNFRLAAGDVTTETDWREWLEDARKAILDAGDGSASILD